MSTPPGRLSEPRGASAPAFPFDAVRDLLGVVRALYAAAREGGAGRNDLARIARVGERLGRGLDLAGSPRQGASSDDEAWRHVEQAMADIGDLVDPLTPAAPIVAAARRRLTGSGAVRRRG